jgi:hypothetical protein
MIPKLLDRFWLRPCPMKLFREFSGDGADLRAGHSPNDCFQEDDLEPAIVPKAEQVSENCDRQMKAPKRSGWIPGQARTQKTDKAISANQGAIKVEYSDRHI